MAEFDYKEYARQMRENCIKDYNGNIICSAELWEQIASIIETTADVVPKSEVESINPIQEAIEQKKKENKESALGVLNELLDEKDAEIKRLKAENKTLQGDLVIWKQNRFNLYQRLELYKIAQEKVAREIFEEIEKDGKYAISFVENHKSYSEEVRQAKLECYKDIQNYIAELKKKYAKEGK